MVWREGVSARQHHRSKHKPAKPHHGSQITPIGAPQMPDGMGHAPWHSPPRGRRLAAPGPLVFFDTLFMQNKIKIVSRSIDRRRGGPPHPPPSSCSDLHLIETCQTSCKVVPAFHRKPCSGRTLQDSQNSPPTLTCAASQPLPAPASQPAAPPPPRRRGGSSSLQCAPHVSPRAVSAGYQPCRCSQSLL